MAQDPHQSERDLLDIQTTKSKQLGFFEATNSIRINTGNSSLE